MRLSIFCIPATFLSCTLLTGLTAQIASARQPSSFQNSCYKLYIIGDVLYGTCKNFWGSDNKTSVQLLGISNINGILTNDGTKEPASFSETCYGISFNYYTNGYPFIAANCIENDGKTISYNTQLALDGITNYNGGLYYYEQL